MTIDEGIKLQGKPVVIQDCLRAELPGFLYRNGFHTGAEVGVYKGGFSKLFCEAGLKHYAIDPWMAFDGQGRSQQRQERQDFLYEHTCRELSGFDDCTIIRKTSMEALAGFEDESLDYVYIDGDHSFPFVAQDIYEWSKKVRQGGVVSGHDYFDTPPHWTNLLCHVRVVVDAYAKLFRVPNWWLFGQQRIRKGSFHILAGTKDDRYFSWMWFKP